MKHVFTFLACVLASLAFSQSTYNVSYYANPGTNPGNINTETDATTTGWTQIIAGPQSANVWSNAVTIPFAFNFYGNPVTSFKASQNGMVTFSQATSPLLPSTNANLPSGTLPDSTIAGLWDSFTSAPPTGSGDNVYYKVFGTAPNRQFWIRWYSFEQGNPVISFLYYAIVLEETSNNIYVVDQYSSATPLATATVGVQLNGTTAVQYGADNLAQSGNGTAITDNDYYEFIPVFLSNNNAGITDFTSPPAPFTAGLHNIDVVITNFGSNALTSATIEWEINGVAQTPFSWTGNLAPSTSSTPVTIGNYTFPSGSTTLKAWTTNPNGVADTNPVDDTLETGMCSAYSGLYTVGGASATFPTITAAITALTNCGVTGPVILNVNPGTYPGNYTITPIPGAGPGTPIIFDGGNSNTTILSNASDATLHLKGADYITWRRFGFIHSGTTDAYGVRLTDTADHNTIDRCRFYMNPTVGNTDVIAIVASGSLTDDFVEGNHCNYCTFTKNYINGGEMAFHFEGSDVGGVATWMTGITIVDNVVDSVDDYGVYVDNLDSLIISGNRLGNFNEPTNADGLYLLDIMNMQIVKNEITVPDYGLYIADGNVDGTPTGQSKIQNNMIKSSGDYAAYLDGLEATNVYHNTLYGVPAIRINDVFTSNFRNNIFTSDVDFAFESDDAANIGSLDYNLYWTPSSNANFAKFGATTYPDLISWQAAFPAANANSIEAQPHFVSPTDLHRMGLNGNNMGDDTLAVSDDIDGDLRTLFPAGNPDMGADEYVPMNNDAVFTGLVSPTNWICGDSLFPITIVISNFADTIYTMPITVVVSGDANQTFNYTYNGALGFTDYDTITVGTVNIYNGGTLTVSGYTSLAGDQNNDNDTLQPVTFNILPYLPVGYDTTVCGNTAVLTAMTGLPVAYGWYDSLVGGTQVGSGPTFTVPSISTQSTYYLQYENSSSSLTTTYAGGVTCAGGAMLNLTSLSGTVISGFDVSTTVASGSPLSVTVHYIANGTYAGNETNPGAWTTLGTYTTTSAGTGNPSSITLGSPLNIPANIQYAIYLEYPASYTSGGNTYVSAGGDITVQTGVGLCSSFGGINQGRTFNGTIYFATGSCGNQRTPVTASNFPIPVSSFTYTNTGPIFTFTNTAVDENSVLYLFGDGNQSTSNNPTYTYSTMGGATYNVCMVAVGTCVNDTSCQTIVAPGLDVEDLTSTIGMQIVPNPTDGIFALTLQTTRAGAHRLRVFTLQASEVYTENFTVGSGSNTRTVDLSALPAGSYFIRVDSEKEYAVQRLVIK